MPTPLKRLENQRKHLTREERDKRAAAEESLETGKRTTLRAPAWLSAEARVIFRSTVKRLRGFDLLEAVDTDLLANYADAMARYQSGLKTLTAKSEPKEITAVQAWSRMALAYADKLGFSQTARARLARRKAQQEEVDPMAALLDNVTDFVNQDGQ